ncbi:hypothetical protein [Caulobacter segnis]|uniref:Uncharacterized protein n=1 Tax=Caulobacter segnis TaxID=88688 RepID=A0A2W5V664_9CAUL|nr:hypothetical protein [Caulobacter segnis]PZR34227.1 MAG: hypothetical protein DI526_11000 [Caulobacter segnis]
MPRWMSDLKWMLVGTALLAAALTACICPFPTAGDGDRWRYLVVVVLVLAWMMAVGKAFNGRVDGLLIDGRNRISLSRLQLFLWLVVAASAFAVEVAHNFRLQGSTPDDITVPTQLGLVMAAATTSFVASPAILALKSRSGRLDVRPRGARSRWSDLFRGEEQGTSRSADPAKVQQFLVTLMLVAIYVATLWRDLGSPPAAGYTALPGLSEGGLVLLGVSHAAYLGGKASSLVRKDSAAADDPVSVDTAPKPPEASQKPAP